MEKFRPTLNRTIYILLAVVLLVSCKDDEDPVIDKANLTGDTWTYDHADAGDQIASALVDAFLEGTQYTFNTDGSYVQLTTIFGEATVEGTWEYSQAMITLDAGEELEEVWEVIELSSTTLAYISTTVDDESGDESTVTFIYTR
ncbi:MAG: lipocalin family protein [Reichenbachiella sp.]|uniref:lipocalin family protein n=1 Tax=Reichenbachiella sp. TaxID=2184521 RepID=UPI00326567DC